MTTPNLIVFLQASNEDVIIIRASGSCRVLKVNGSALSGIEIQNTLTKFKNELESK